jgi:hypothetical protein
MTAKHETFLPACFLYDSWDDLNTNLDKSRILSRFCRGSGSGFASSTFLGHPWSVNALEEMPSCYLAGTSVTC